MHRRHQPVIAAPLGLRQRHLLGVAPPDRRSVFLDQRDLGGTAFFEHQRGAPLVLLDHSAPSSAAAAAANSSAYSSTSAVLGRKYSISSGRSAVGHSRSSACRSGLGSIK